VTTTEPDPGILDAIERRVSWRSYADQAVTGAVRAQLDGVIADPPAGPFGSKLRLALIDASAEQRRSAKLGTYGVVKSAPLFLAGVVADGPQALEDFGYVFEWAVLEITRLDLGTCWLGGTFKRDRFGRALDAQGGELVPAVSMVRGHIPSLEWAPPPRRSGRGGACARERLEDGLRPVAVARSRCARRRGILPRRLPRLWLVRSDAPATSGDGAGGWPSPRRRRPAAAAAGGFRRIL